MLEQCLNSLNRVQIPPKTELQLILVDNDPSGSAKPTFDKVTDGFRYPAYYVVQPERGIVSMRNKVLEEALRLEVDFLAFIDDDEVAETSWLVELWNGLNNHHADVVAGYVEQILPEDTPAHLRKFYKLSTHPTGMIRNSGSTRNIMFSMKLCTKMGLRFNPALNLSGSSDTFFFEEAFAAGAKMVWVQEAVVYEEIPHSRISANWIWNRAYRHGNSLVVRTQIREGRLSAFRLLPSALLKFFVGAMLWIIYSPINRTHRIGKIKRVKMALGMMSALFGKKYLEYKTVHGH